MLRFSVVCIVALLAAAACAQTVPYELSKGRTPDIPFSGYLADGNQFLIRNKIDGGYHSWSWDEDANYVKLHVFYSGDASALNGRRVYEFDPSNSKNQWPMEVHGGKWRLAICVRMGMFPTTYYYWPNGTFAGSEYDYYGISNLPNRPGIIAQQIPGSVMIMSDWLNIRGGVIDQVLTFRYDRFLNFMGTTGVVFTDINFQLNDSMTWNTIYSNPNSMVKPVPSYSWADLLTDVNNGGSIGILPTYQPYPEPIYLRGRDNMMRGQFAMMTAGLAGPFGPRLADTATCWSFYQGTPDQQADPYHGDLQIRAWWTVSACVLSTPVAAAAKRDLAPQQFYKMQYVSPDGNHLVPM